MAVTFFRTIPIELPNEMIMTRLGYRSSKTRMSDQQRAYLDATVAHGFALCQAQGCWRRIRIKEKREDSVILQDGSSLVSRSLRKLLHNSHAVVLMAATVGSAIVVAAADAIEAGAGARAIILDAVGGQSAEATMTWINRYLGGQLSRHAERLTEHRFSPGYGDFHLANQPLIYSLLELDQLDLSLTSRFMLVPEKSVTAVVGIEHASPTGQLP